MVKQIDIKNQVTVTPGQIDLSGTVAGPLTIASRPVMRVAISSLHLKGRLLKLAAGLYIVVATAKAGKSVLLAGLRAAAVEQGWVNVGAMYVFEPGAPDYTNPNGDPYFTNPASFLEVQGGEGDLGKYLGSAVSGNADQLSLLTIDSINDPMKSFLSSLRAREPGGSKGYSTMDKIFVQRLNNWSIARKLCVLAVLNTQFVEYAESLQGATQGLIKVQAPNAFTIIDRANGRVVRQFELDDEYLQAGLAAMGYNATQQD